MSKRAADLANNLFPDRRDIPCGNDFANIERRKRYIQGYEQAEKDIISIIESRIGEILGDAQPVPVLRAELQELIKRIKGK